MYENDNFNSFQGNNDTSNHTDNSNMTSEHINEEQMMQGRYSSSQMQEQYGTSQTTLNGQIYSAGNIQSPKKKNGLGKRIAILCLSGLLLGTCAAGAYLGVTYLAEEQFGRGNKLNSVESAIPEPSKNPEISQVQVVNPSSSGRVEAGVVYDVSPIVHNVMPAMVSIVNNYTQTINSFFGQSYTQQGASSGSGIVIGENETELLIASNYHVVSGSDELVVTFIDGTTATAYMKGSDEQMDLAVVAVQLESLTNETKDAIAVAQLGNSDALILGQPVIAIGNALGYGQSVTTGVVSATNRSISSDDGTTAGTFIQTDAAINPGNSGGALLNMNGEVIGINSNKIGGSTIEGMGFAIPINAAEPIISDLSLQSTKIKVDESEQGYLGVTIAEVTATEAQRYGMPQGVFIKEITQGSAAEKAGMMVRDIIVGFDTFNISGVYDLQNAMQYFAAGTTVSVEVMRIQNGGGYQSITLELTLDEKPIQ